MPPPLRVLSNSPLPQPPGFAVRHFGVYVPGGLHGQGGAAWQPQQERRSLKEILARIPVGERPDILLIRSPEYLPVPPDLSSFSGIKVLLITDWNVGLRFLVPLCRLFDLCFTDYPGMRLLLKAGVKNIRHAALYGHDSGHESAKLRDLEVPRDIDLSFCGNLNAGMHRERNRVLVRLLPLRKSHNLHLTQAFGPAYQAVLSRSHLVFNHSIRGEANMRLYEAMACGAIPLVERDNLEVPLLFREGEHYATYDPADPVPDIRALLADKPRLAEMGRAAKQAVTGHSAEKQLGRLLQEAWDHALQNGPLPAPAPDAEKEGQRSLRKLRVLGTGFTLRESIDEIQAASGQDPDLRLSSFPGLLLSLLERERSHPDRVPALLRWVEQFLGDPDMPPLLADFHRLQLAAAGGQPDSIVAAADALLLGLEREGGPYPEELYRHLLSPIDLGKPMNTDINYAYRHRLENRDDSALRDLFKALALAQKAHAFKRRERWSEAAACAMAMPAGRFLSVSPYPIAAEAALRLGDKQTLAATCAAWLADNPLDARVWEESVNRLVAAGELGYLGSYLGDICAMAEAVLREGVPASLAALAKQYGGLPTP